MNKEREALKLALALVLKSKRYADECSYMATQADIDEFDTVANAIKEVLAQTEQEPVAYAAMINGEIAWDADYPKEFVEFVRAIEAAHGIKGDT